MATPKPPYRPGADATHADQEAIMMRLGLMAEWYATLTSTGPDQIGNITYAAHRVDGERTLLIGKICDYAELNSTDPLARSRVGHVVDEALDHYRNPGQLSPRDAATRFLFA